MTPGLDWRAQYADWPVALAKLGYCDRVLAGLAQRKQPRTTVVADTEVYTCVPEGYYADVLPPA
jgi:hypothetical protein